MSEHFFISYSSVDGKDFSLYLADELASGPPAFPVWLDKRHLRPGEAWDEQIVEAIRICKGMIFVMTKDSVASLSVCKDEWVRALRYKKPIIPLLAEQDAELPFRLGSREYIDFTGPFDAALARLRKHLSWLDSPEGQLQSLKYRLADAQRDFPRANGNQQIRIGEEITDLELQIAREQAIIQNPLAAEQRVRETIDRGLERVREPSKPETGKVRSKFINPPPLIAPSWFQDRHVETQLIGNFLKDDALRLMTVVGRGGIGKSAMVCRLLRSLEGGVLPDDGGSLTVDGIVYLSDARSFHRVNVPDLYGGLSQLLSEKSQQQLDSVYKNPQAGTYETMQALVNAFSQGKTVVLLDNFEDAVDVETGRINDAELDEALRALLELPPHGLKLIITTRIAPRELAFVEPGRQRRLDLDSGLGSPYAENVLKAMDMDGKIGLRNAPESLLTQARERTRGYPRALEHLFAILSADRDTSLQEILDNTRQLLPDKVVEVLVGEAFNRLDVTAQRVIQTLATYRYPVPAAAVDYLLQPYVAGIDSGPALSRLVNMQFVRRDAGRYYLHQIDRDYAEGRIAEGEPADRNAETAPFSRFALQHRAAEWFKLARKPRADWKTLEDLSPQLAEFDLRCVGADYDTAASVLLDFGYDYLQLWGHYRLVIEMHERLKGNIQDAELTQANIGNLGTAYYRLAQYPQALTNYELALTISRDQGLRWNEGVWLGNLGNVYAELGQIDRSLVHYQQALKIRREVGDQGGEATDLVNIGNSYADLGQTERAIEYYEQALAIDRDTEDLSGKALDLCNLGNQLSVRGQTDKAMEYLGNSLTIARQIGYRLIETAAHVYLGHVYLDRNDWHKAIQAFKQAIEIADETANTQFQNGARMCLALAGLYQGDIAMAREMAEAAGQYDFPMNNASVSALRGIVALRQGDFSAARTAFSTALAQSRELLNQCPQLYDAWDAQGIAACGMALCEDANHISAATEAFQAARAINSDRGVVQRLLRLFDALQNSDKAGILKDVRKTAAGKDPG